jgi:acyl-CoA thioester hydrolase
VAGWIETTSTVVFPTHCDHLGHMNVRWYAHVFDDASFHIWARLGMTWEAMTAAGAVTVVARTATDFLHEARAGEFLIAESAFTKIGTKSVTYLQRLRNAERDVVHATQEVVEVFFDLETRGSASIPPPFRKIIEGNLVPDAGKA